jgi:hypothetical protein
MSLRSAGKTDATKFHNEALVTSPMRMLFLEGISKEFYVISRSGCDVSTGNSGMQATVFGRC